METLRSNGCFLKSQELSKESQSTLVFSIKLKTIKLTDSLFFSITGIVATSPDCNVSVGLTISAKCLITHEFSNPNVKEIFSLSGKHTPDALSKKYPSGIILNDGYEVILDHEIPDTKSLSAFLTVALPVDFTSSPSFSQLTT